MSSSCEPGPGGKWGTHRLRAVYVRAHAEVQANGEV